MPMTVHPAVFPALTSLSVSPMKTTFVGFTSRILQALSTISGWGFAMVTSSLVITMSK